MADVCSICGQRNCKMYDKIFHFLIVDKVELGSHVSGTLKYTTGNYKILKELHIQLCDKCKSSVHRDIVKGMLIYALFTVLFFLSMVLIIGKDGPPENNFLAILIVIMFGLSMLCGKGFLNRLDVVFSIPKAFEFWFKNSCDDRVLSLTKCDCEFEGSKKIYTRSEYEDIGRYIKL